jgi:glutathione S-transferase
VAKQMLELGVLALVVFAGWFLFENHRRKRSLPPDGYQPTIDLPHEEPFELYHNALSLCSMKSRVCLAELGIPYRSHHVDLIETGAYENIRATYLAVNPGGTVPLLVHEGHPIYESHFQIRYAAEHAPEGSPRLTPEDPELRKQMEAWIDRSSLTHDPLRHGDVSAGNAVPGLTVPLFATMIEHIATWKILEGLLFHFDKMRPSLFLMLKLRGISGVGKITPLSRALARSRAQMDVHLDALEAQLAHSGGPWILGELYTLADVSWLVIFERLVQVDLLDSFVAPELRPLCLAWWERVRARPAYRQAITDQSHPVIAYGLRRLQEAKAGDPALRLLLEGSGR